MARLNIALLGPPHIAIDGVPLTVDTRKAIALLAYLAVTGTPHRRDSLAALLWPEADEQRARAALRRTLSTLAAALGDRWLSASRHEIALDLRAGAWFDVAELRAIPTDASTARLREVAALYRDDLLAGFTLRDAPAFDDWQRQQADELRRHYAGLLERLAAALAAEHEFADALGYARRWLALDPLHEAAHRQVMLLHAWAGERAAALRQYRDCVRILADELDVAPLDETTALYLAIQERREPPPATVAGEPPPRQPLTASASPEPVRPAPDVPLVGRASELQALAAAWQASAAGGRLAVVRGEAGIGKSRLAGALLELARAGGAVCVAVRCYEGETGLAYGPIIASLRAALAATPAAVAPDATPAWVLVDLSRLLPELGTPVPAPPALAVDGPGAQARLLDSILQTFGRALAGPIPGLLLLDDSQWIDSASLELLGFLVRRLAQHRFLLLLTWRDEDVPDDHPLRRLLVEATRDGRSTDLPLARLALPDVQRLTDAVLGDGTRAELGARLFRETEGLPFVVVEYLRALGAAGAVAAGDDWRMPASVRATLLARLAALPPVDAQLLATLAVAGGACAFDILREASGRSLDEALTAVEGLLRRGLVAELDAADDREPRYAFTHDKLRELAYAETSLARRRLLHRRVADALLAAPGADRAAAAAQAAYHYRLAGADADAARQYRAAGDRALALYAPDDALAHFTTALALGHPDVAGLQLALGDLHVLQGRFDAAFAAYETAAAHGDGARLGAVERRLGNLDQRLGRWERAEQHFAAAAAALTGADAGATRDELARLYVDWSLLAQRRGELERALNLATEALELARHARDPRALAQAHNLLGMLRRASGDLPAARVALQEALRLATGLGDLAGRVAALNNLALIDAALGETERGIALAREALDQCVQIGDRHREAALRSNLADLLHVAGQQAEAREQVVRSAAIYADIGVVGGELQPEIWKLVAW